MIARFAQVALPLPLAQPYTYSVPDTLGDRVVPGTRVVGTFPKEIAYVNGYAGAIPKDTASEPGQAFLSYLTSPASKERFKSFGLE